MNARSLHTFRVVCMNQTNTACSPSVVNETKCKTSKNARGIKAITITSHLISSHHHISASSTLLCYPYPCDPTNLITPSSFPTRLILTGFAISHPPCSNPGPIRTFILSTAFSTARAFSGFEWLP